MADHPILFKGPMVSALLEGRKTQTRRLASSPLRKRQPGDRLWVRETWAEVGTVDPGYIITRADYPQCAAQQGLENVPAEQFVKWTPSIFMRRKASRLTLTVTDVRLQRLQEISWADAEAEGGGLPPTELFPNINRGSKIKDQFPILWDSINAKRAPWESNPEVVAITFTVEKRNVDR